MKFDKGDAVFNYVHIVLDDKKKELRASGYFGTRIVKAILEGIPKSKLKYLFTKVSMSEIHVKEFFIFELYHVLKNILQYGSVRSVNAEALLKIVEFIDTEVWGKHKFEHTLNYQNIDDKMNYKILEHQKRAFSGFINIRNKLGYRGYLLDAAVGSGKTFTSLALAESLDSEKIIVICPLPTLEKVWVSSVKEELYKHEQTFWTSRSKEDYNNERILLIHYDAIEKLQDILSNIKTAATTIIVDESHNFNELKSRRTTALIDTINEVNPANVVLMSGTPIKAKVSEILPLMRMIDKGFDRYIEKRFLGIYKAPGAFFKELLPVRYREFSVKIEKTEMDLPELHTEYVKIELKNSDQYLLTTIRDKVKKYILARKTEVEANMEKYKTVYKTVYEKYKELLINNGTIKQKEFMVYEREFGEVIKAYERKQLMMYPDLLKRVNSFEEQLLKYMEGYEKTGFREAKTILKYLALKLQGEALANVVMRERINCHADMARSFDYKELVNSTVKKTIIFSNYIDVCNAAVDGLEDQGYKNVLEVYGDTSKLLSQTVTAFNSEKKYNPLVTTYKSLSTGVPLIVANVIIAIDLPFRSYIYEQAVARAHRLGQDLPVFTYIMELDTGEDANINSRNIDIISFFKEEVERITGYKVNIDLERNFNMNIAQEAFEDLTMFNDMVIRKDNSVNRFKGW